METQVRYELNTITEINGRVYPTNAPDTSTQAYAVYMRTSTDINRGLDEQGQSGSVTFIVSIMSNTYSEMHGIRNKAQDLILSFAKRNIGTGNTRYIQDVEINNITDRYEEALNKYRGIIDFTIYY